MTIIIRKLCNGHAPGDRLTLPDVEARAMIDAGLAFSVEDTKLAHRMENADVCPHYHT